MSKINWNLSSCLFSKLNVSFCTEVRFSQYSQYMKKKIWFQNHDLQVMKFWPDRFLWFSCISEQNFEKKIVGPVLMSHCFNGTSPQFKRILFDIQNLEDVTATGGVKARRYMPHVQKRWQTGVWKLSCNHYPKRHLQCAIPYYLPS